MSESDGKKNANVDEKKSGKAAKKASNAEGVELPGFENLQPSTLPVVPARDIVPFPSVIMSLYIDLGASVEALEYALENEVAVILLAQQEPEIAEPDTSQLYRTGVLCSIVRTLKLPDNRYKALLQGLERCKIKDFATGSGKFLSAEYELIPHPSHMAISAEHEVLLNRIQEGVRILVENEQLPEEILVIIEDIDDPATLADVIIAHYRLEIPEAQAALEEIDPLKRLRFADEIVTDDLNQFLVTENVRNQARDEMTKDQREYYLREQIKHIRKELGEDTSQKEELAELEEALQKAKLPEHAEKEAKRQLTRLKRMHSESSEYAMLRTYLEWVGDLPWAVKTRERVDLKRAREILDRDHYGLKKVKDRILEYLSVRKLKKDSQGPILCFVGPPGVGKTSLGQSIAKSINRNFYRMSVGGVRDEAEIRGHRRTYVGALPGRVIQGLKQAGSNNPVFMLDELDKVGADFRGDPASALLEVLDPQQNKEFTDHYLNMSFDLSNVMFIATANTLDTIPDALLDRLEVIYLPGYTNEEKVAIAERYLVPRQLDKNGLGKSEMTFVSGGLDFLIDRYTREAGVRNLEREIGSLFRKVAREKVETKKQRKRVTIDFITSSLGPTRYDPELDDKNDSVGLVRGLAWTVHGGEMMPIEASFAKGKGQLSLTGRLGDVMQESAKAAMFYARANADALGLDPNFHQKYDIHVHVPGGATPKDGPSAGIAMVTALVSALSGRPVSHEVAMTGEITLRGSVMQIGGLKEKALAALRYGIKKVIIPYENIKDLEEIPKKQREQLKFIPVKHIGEVLEIALLDKPKRTRRKAKSSSKAAKSKKVLRV